MALEIYDSSTDSFVAAASNPLIKTGDRMIYRSDGHNGNTSITGFKAHPGAKFVIWYPYDYDGSTAITAGTCTLAIVDPITGETSEAAMTTGANVTSSTLASASPTAGYSFIVPTSFSLVIASFASGGETVDIMCEIHY